LKGGDAGGDKKNNETRKRQRKERKTLAFSKRQEENKGKKEKKTNGLIQRLTRGNLQESAGVKRGDCFLEGGGKKITEKKRGD